jgi:DNA polymerase III epsilon subunit-like protein
MTALAFVDTETLGLDADVHAMWELAIIRRENGVDTEHLWQIKPSKIDLEHADPEALRINGYAERMALPEDYWAGDMSHLCGIPHPMKRDELRTVITELLTGAVMIGSNPAFDAAFLKVFLDGTPWHYRTIDVATLAAGYRHGQAASGAYGGDFAFAGDLPSQPFSSRKLSQAVGVEPPGDGVAHTALGDARWARDVYDAVTGGAK